MKRKCAEAAFKMIREGMVVGLGGGETIQYLIEFIHMSGIKVKVVTPSAKTALIAAQHELEIIPTWLCDHVDIAFDGCNEIDRQLLCLKSMGAIHTQEKIIGSMADEYVILAPETRFFEHLSFDVPLTIEIMKDAYSCIMKKLFDLGFTAAPRSSKEKDGFVMSDNGNIIVDIDMRNVEDPVQANETISALYGVVDTSLFANVVTKALIASKEGIEIIEKKEAL